MRSSRPSLFERRAEALAARCVRHCARPSRRARPDCGCARGLRACAPCVASSSRWRASVRGIRSRTRDPRPCTPALLAAGTARGLSLCVSAAWARDERRRRSGRRRTRAARLREGARPGGGAFVMGPIWSRPKPADAVRTVTSTSARCPLSGTPGNAHRKRPRLATICVVSVRTWPGRPTAVLPPLRR